MDNISQPSQPNRMNVSEFLENLNGINIQLDNSPLLQRVRCRFLGGYYDEDGGWHEDYKLKPLINEKGFNVIEQLIDKNTCPNEVLSNKKDWEIKAFCTHESIALLKNICNNYEEYEVDINDIEFIVLTCAGIIFSGQKRALEGQTAKAINKVIKQIEQVLKEDNQPKKGGLFSR